MTWYTRLSMRRMNSHLPFRESQTLLISPVSHMIICHGDVTISNPTIWFRHQWFDSLAVELVHCSLWYPNKLIRRSWATGSPLTSLMRAELYCNIAALPVQHLFALFLTQWYAVKVSIWFHHVKTEARACDCLIQGWKPLVSTRVPRRRVNRIMHYEPPNLDLPYERTCTHRRNFQVFH